MVYMPYGPNIIDINMGICQKHSDPLSPWSKGGEVTYEKWS